MRSAVVLVGETSSSESIPHVDGRPVVERIVDRIAPAVEDIVVSANAEQAGAVESALAGTDYRLAVDRVPDGGPVAGIRSGCRVARGRRTFVTGGQFPAVGAELVTALFDAHRDDGAVAHVEGRPRPLVAVYDTDAAIEAAETTLGMGSRATTDLLDRLDVATVARSLPPRADGNRTGQRSTESGST
jgi:molybdopterin-guanine dinucleotide biosynthesis protein A